MGASETRLAAICRTLLGDEVAGVDAPAHLDRIADLEEFRAAALRVREQRLDPRAARRLDAVDGDVAHVEQVGDLAAEMVVRRVEWSARRDANLLRSQRHRAPRASGE